MNEPLPKFIHQQAERLKRAGIDAGRAEVELILCHLLDQDRLHLYLNGKETIDDAVMGRFEEIMVRREKREPLQFILSEAYFYGRTFYVTPDVMAPTPETELLCEAATTFLTGQKIAAPEILDLGVGSGVISVTLALELDNSRIVSVDLSPPALEVARRNADKLGAGDRIDFRESDLFAAIEDGQQFDLIASNPPYIAERDYEGLPPEVLADPKMSLVGGEEGLDIITRILEQAPSYLKPNGRLMFEIGYDQAEKIAALTSHDSRYSSLTILKDLNDIDRIVILGCE